MGVSIVLCLLGGIVPVLVLEALYVPLPLSRIPTIGFFVSLPWIFVCWKFIKSAEKYKDIRQRRRCVLYWIYYSAVVGLFNLGAFVLFIVLLTSKYNYHGNEALITDTIIASVILRGFVFAVVFIYSKKLLHKAETSITGDKNHGNPSSKQYNEPTSKYEDEATGEGNSQKPLSTNCICHNSLI